MGRGWQNVGAEGRARCWAPPDQHPAHLPVPPSTASGQCNPGEEKSQRAKAPDSHSFIPFIHFREKVLFPIKGGGKKSDSKLFVGGCVQRETAQLGDTAVSSWETVGLDRPLAPERDRAF